MSSHHARRLPEDPRPAKPHWSVLAGSILRFMTAVLNHGDRIKAVFSALSDLLP